MVSKCYEGAKGSLCVALFVTAPPNCPHPSSWLSLWLPTGAHYWLCPEQITATLVSSGIKAVVMNQTLGHPLTGCFGHPSAADNVEIAANVAPGMASVLGW